MVFPPGESVEFATKQDVQKHMYIYTRTSYTLYIFSGALIRLSWCPLYSDKHTVEQEIFVA